MFFDVVATRDIAAGEEIFLDYGKLIFVAVFFFSDFAHINDLTASIRSQRLQAKIGKMHGRNMCQTIKILAPV